MSGSWIGFLYPSRALNCEETNSDIYASSLSCLVNEIKLFHVVFMNERMIVYT